MPWETSERLLKSIESDASEKYEIEYDDMGRPVRIVTDENYGYVQTNTITYGKNSMTTTTVIDYGDGNPDDTSTTWNWDEEGYMTGCPTVMTEDGPVDMTELPYLQKFEYSDNYLVRLYDESIQNSDNIWENDNLTDGYTFVMDGNFTYLDAKNKVNMFFYGTVTPKFKGHTSMNYIKTRTTAYGTSSEYDYVLDEDGYVISMTEHRTDQHGSRDVKYTFTYYE